MLRVNNMKSTRGNYVPNQFIIDNIDENTGEILSITFQSYDSTIIVIDYENHNINVYDDYNYSKTTGKYRNIFFEEVGLIGLNTLKELEKAMEKSFFNTSISCWNVNKMF